MLIEGFNGPVEDASDVTMLFQNVRLEKAITNGRESPGRIGIQRGSEILSVSDA